MTYYDHRSSFYIKCVTVGHYSDYTGLSRNAGHRRLFGDLASAGILSLFYSAHRRALDTTLGAKLLTHQFTAPQLRQCSQFLQYTRAVDNTETHLHKAVLERPTVFHTLCITYRLLYILLTLSENFRSLSLSFEFFTP
jgi:hypothetical protein